MNMASNTAYKVTFLHIYLLYICTFFLVLSYLDLRFTHNDLENIEKDKNIWVTMAGIGGNS